MSEKGSDWILKWTGSQCKNASTRVIWSCCFFPVRKRQGLHCSLLTVKQSDDRSTLTNKEETWDTFQLLSNGSTKMCPSQSLIQAHSFAGVPPVHHDNFIESSKFHLQTAPWGTRPFLWTTFYLAQRFLSVWPLVNLQELQYRPMFPFILVILSRLFFLSCPYITPQVWFALRLIPGFTCRVVLELYIEFHFSIHWCVCLV